MVQVASKEKQNTEGDNDDHTLCLFIVLLLAKQRVIWILPLRVCMRVMTLNPMTMRRRMILLTRTAFELGVSTSLHHMTFCQSWKWKIAMESMTTHWNYGSQSNLDARIKPTSSRILDNHSYLCSIWESLVEGIKSYFSKACLPQSWGHFLYDICTRECASNPWPLASTHARTSPVGILSSYTSNQRSESLSLNID